MCRENIPDAPVAPSTTRMRLVGRWSCGGASLCLLGIVALVEPVLGEEPPHWSTPLADDPDFPAYLKFLQQWRSHAERRRMNSHSRERFEIFKATLRDIEYRSAHDTATYGVNMFSDLTDEEFESQWTSGRQHWNKSIARDLAAGYTGFDPALSNHTHRRMLERRRQQGGDERVIDWRFKDGGKVTKTKNQGGCGSCWAFAAIEQLESDHAIANNQVDSCPPPPRRAATLRAPSSLSKTRQPPDDDPSASPPSHGSALSMPKLRAGGRAERSADHELHVRAGSFGLQRRLAARRHQAGHQNGWHHA